MVVQVPLVDFSKTIRLADIPHYYAPDENSGLAAEGLIWFAEEMDRHIWLRAIGAKDEDHLVLQFEQYRLNLRLFTGFVSLPNWPTNMLQIIYIPVNGLGERMLYEKLHRTSKGKHSFHFLRLFQTSELGYHPNEDPAVQVLWDEVASQFNTFPFLGLATTSTYPLLQEWLARIVILSHARRQIHAIEEYVQQARWQTVDRLQRLTTFNRITSEEGLCSLLVARYQTQQRIAEFRDLATHLERLTQVKDTTPVQLDQEAKNCSDDTMRKFYHTPLNVSLGGELSPGLRRLLPQFDRFAQELVGSPIPDLQDMGIELKKLRAEKSEVLALIGAFSSGKTTLLNALLGGNSSKRLFRVNTAANTAIVSEIRAVAAGEYESVHFNFRPQIEHVLASPSPYGFDISLVKNIEALQKLVYSGVLTASQIEIVAPQVREHEPGKTLAILKGPDEITECLTRFLKAALNADTEVVGFPRGTVYFSAKVDQKRLRDTLLGSELAEAIDLRTEVGWDQFQGKKPSVEGDLASFLIERAEVRLHIPLLELTTIADTPGTGSYNDRHDIVTDTYLNRAAGFILLLPTQRTDATGVQEILDRLCHELTVRYQGNPVLGLNSVAFVVNCYTGLGPDLNQKLITLFETKVCQTFKLTRDEWKARQANPQLTNFFVVSLKHVEEGKRLEELFRYPSLNALKRWIEQLFRTQRYRARHMRLRQVLAEDWNERLARKRQELNEIRRQTRDNDTIIKQLRSFRQKGLENITQEHLRQIKDFRNRFHASSNSIRAQVARELTNFKSYAVNLKLEDLRQWHNTFEAYYERFNTELSWLEGSDFAEDWIEEIKVELRKIGVSPPPLVAPDTAGQTPPWSRSRRFNKNHVKKEFDGIIERWPQTMTDRVVQWFRRTFTGNDTRKALVETICDTFWPQQYSAIWDKQLETYLVRCEQFIREGTKAVQQRCEEQEKKESVSTHASRTTDLETIVEALSHSPFAEKRRQLLQMLESELTPHAEA